MNDTLDKTCDFNADKSRINQILSNLLENAIKYSNNDSYIDIIVAKELPEIIKDKPETMIINNLDMENWSLNSKTNVGECVYVSISDYGKGISDEILPKLFQKFLSSSNYGTGLDLYISKKLAEAMGGKIWAYNNNDRIGATFVFSLLRTETK